MDKNKMDFSVMEQLQHFHQPVMDLLCEYRDKFLILPEVSNLLDQTAHLLNNTAEMAFSALQLAMKAEPSPKERFEMERTQFGMVPPHIFCMLKQAVFTRELRTEKMSTCYDVIASETEVVRWPVYLLAALDLMLHPERYSLPDRALGKGLPDPISLKGNNFLDTVKSFAFPLHEMEAVFSDPCISNEEKARILASELRNPGFSRQQKTLLMVFAAFGLFALKEGNPLCLSPEEYRECLLVMFFEKENAFFFLPDEE